jgi:hypothetical protein
MVGCPGRRVAGIPVPGASLAFSRPGRPRLGLESPEAPLKAPGQIEVVEALAEAIKAGCRAVGDEGIVVVTGSLSTAGEARTLLVGPVE